MDKITYLDFDLLIEQVRSTYTARVLNSPAGQMSARFRLPFSNLELENFILKVGRTRRGVRLIGSPEMQTAREFGSRLFEAVFSDELRSTLRTSLSIADSQKAGLRLRLRLVNAPKLLNLPWEYLYDPAQNRFWVLSAETPLVRYLELPEKIQPLAVQPPLNVLVMISAPRDFPPLDVQHEWENLKNTVADLEARRLISVTLVKEATLSALQRQLRKGGYHVFHFIGHGGFDAQTQDGLLLMEDAAGLGRTVSGRDLGIYLHDHPSLRLVVLNSCEGGRTAQADPFAGAAQSLVQQGIPAVIAMQFEITDKAAITLSHEFYAALCEGYSVDTALGEARKAIYATGNDVEWGTPVLYLRAPDGVIFDIAPEMPGELLVETSSSQDLPQAVEVSEVEVTPLPIQEAPALEISETAPSPADPEILRRLERLYIDGVSAIHLEEWEKARRNLGAIVELSPGYKDAERRLEWVNGQDRWAGLYLQARAAEDGRDWDAAQCLLEQLTEETRAVMYQGYKDSDARLEKILQQKQKEEQRQVEIESLYTQALTAMDAGDWQLARQNLSEVKARQADYRDTSRLLSLVEREIARKISPRKSPQDFLAPIKSALRIRQVMKRKAVIEAPVSQQVAALAALDTPFRVERLLMLLGGGWFLARFSVVWLFSFLLDQYIMEYSLSTVLVFQLILGLFFAWLFIQGMKFIHNPMEPNRIRKVFIGFVLALAIPGLLGWSNYSLVEAWSWHIGYAVVGMYTGFAIWWAVQARSLPSGGRFASFKLVFLLGAGFFLASWIGEFIYNWAYLDTVLGVSFTLGISSAFMGLLAGLALLRHYQIAWGRFDWRVTLAGVIGFGVAAPVAFYYMDYNDNLSYYVASAFLGLVGGGALGAPAKNVRRILLLALLGATGSLLGVWIHLAAELDSFGQISLILGASIGLALGLSTRRLAPALLLMFIGALIIFLADQGSIGLYYSGIVLPAHIMRGALAGGALGAGLGWLDSQSKG